MNCVGKILFLIFSLTKKFMFTSFCQCLKRSERVETYFRRKLVECIFDISQYCMHVPESGMKRRDAWTTIGVYHTSNNCTAGREDELLMTILFISNSRSLQRHDGVRGIQEGRRCRQLNGRESEETAWLYIIYILIYPKRNIIFSTPIWLMMCVQRVCVLPFSGQKFHTNTRYI